MRIRPPIIRRTELKTRTFATFMIVALLAGLGAHLAGEWITPRTSLLLHDTDSIDISNSAVGGDFRLIDHMGAPRSLADYRGKVVVLFFGFTHCPDICPTTLSLLKSALAELGDDARQVQVLFVSLDPGRDTPAALASYVSAFDPRFTGLTGDTAAVDGAARAFKVPYFRYDLGTGNYTVDHGGGIFMLDRRGRARILSRADAGAAGIAGDILALIELG